MNLHIHNPTGESAMNFCEAVYFRLWFWLKVLLRFKMTCCIFVFLKILLAVRVIRSYLTIDFKLLQMAFKLLNYHWQFQYDLTQMLGFSFTWIANSHELKIFALWWIIGKQKFPDENQCLDWIKSILGVDWLIMVDLPISICLNRWFYLFNHNL